MVGDSTTITTHVDSLVDILKEKKELSMEDAVEILGLPQPTIEAWATFLEEEEVLNIRYKQFGAPYLVLNQKPKNMRRIISLSGEDNKDGHSQSTRDVEKMMTHIEDAFEMVKEYEKQKKYEQTKPEYAAILDDLNSIHDKILKDHKSYKGTSDDRAILSIKSEVYSLLTELENALRAKTDIKTLNALFDKINKKIEDYYLRINQLLINPPVEKKKHHLVSDDDLAQMQEKKEKIENIVKEISKQKGKMKLSPKREAFIKKHLTSNDGLRDKINKLVNVAEQAKEGQLAFMNANQINEYLDQAYECLKSGDFETAEQIYQKIHLLHEELPKLYVENKKKLENSLASLNKDISQSFGKVTEKELDKGKRKILNMISKSDIQLKKGNLGEATRLYNSAEQNFRKMPKGYLNIRNEIEEHLTSLYYKIMKQRDSTIKGKMNEEYISLKKLLVLAEEAVVANNLESAKNNYIQLTKRFQNLPGFYAVIKSELESRLIEVRKKILQLDYNNRLKDFTQKSEIVNKYYVSSAQALGRGDIKNAHVDYVRLENVFNTLPEGFLDQKTLLEEKKLKLKHALQKLIHDHKQQEFKVLRAHVDDLISTIELYIQKKDYEIAKEVYSELMYYFGRISVDFLDYKNEIHPKIIQIYQDIVQNLDTEILGTLDEELRKKYDTVLRLIVKCRRAVHGWEMGVVKITYSHILQLYEQFPLWLVNKKVTIKDELIKIESEIKLYDQVMRYGQISETPEAKGVGDDIKSMYTRMMSKYPEEMPFLEKIREIYVSKDALPIGQHREIDTSGVTNPSLAPSLSKTLTSAQKTSQPPKLIMPGQTPSQKSPGQTSFGELSGQNQYEKTKVPSSNQPFGPVRISNTVPKKEPSIQPALNFQKDTQSIEKPASQLNILSTSGSDNTSKAPSTDSTINTETGSPASELAVPRPSSYEQLLKPAKPQNINKNTNQNNMNTPIKEQTDDVDKLKTKQMPMVKRIKSKINKGDKDEIKTTQKTKPQVDIKQKKGHLSFKLVEFKQQRAGRLNDIISAALERTKRYISNGDYDEAAKDAELVLKLDKTNQEANEYIKFLNHRRGIGKPKIKKEPVKVTEPIKKEEPLTKDKAKRVFIDHHIRKSRDLLNKNKLNEAKKTINSVLRHAPDNENALNIKNEIFSRIEKSDEKKDGKVKKAQAKVIEVTESQRKYQSAKNILLKKYVNNVNQSIIHGNYKEALQYIGDILKYDSLNKFALAKKMEIEQTMQDNRDEDVPSPPKWLKEELLSD
ncbi:hypothetical protein K9M79_00130 [Candidatus Woesearchaeota archaeon]|nr:hypothetical protein [Candidatus Woesearchaeota archaeon]